MLTHTGARRSKSSGLKERRACRIVAKIAWVPAALCVIAAPAWAAGPALQPGVYDELLIGYEPSTQTVTGYFHSETGAGQYSCIFYLNGKLSGRTARIESYFPETPKDRIDGTPGAPSI